LKLGERERKREIEIHREREREREEKNKQYTGTIVLLCVGAALCKKIYCCLDPGAKSSFFLDALQVTYKKVQIDFFKIPGIST
jgi:hypothetical protein